MVDKYPGDPVLVTEADEPNIEALAKMYGNGDEVQLPMDFQIADVNELSAAKFRKLFDEVENNPAHGQPEYFFRITISRGSGIAMATGSTTTRLRS